MKEQILQAVKDIVQREKYFRTAFEIYRTGINSAPSTEVTDNRRSRVPIVLIGPAARKQMQEGIEAAADAYREATAGRMALDFASLERLINELPDNNLTAGQKAQINSILETYSKITVGPVVHLIKELRNAL